MKVISLIFLLICSKNIFGQGIRFYADVMINAAHPENRKLAATEFSNLFQAALDAPQSFHQSFEELEWVSIEYPDDRTFRTLTWQLDEGNGKYSYDGYIQSHDGKSHRIKGKQGIGSDKINRVIEWDQWRGGIVYKILTMSSNGAPQYYLLAFNQVDQFTKQKSLEPLQFKDGEVILGAEGLFEQGDSKRKAHRLALTYSADSNTSITYKEASNHLVLDHLIPMMGRIQGQGPTQVPDGSYVAYELQPDGSWKFLEKLYDQKFTEPPRGGLKSGGKDIFGRPKN